MDYMDQSLSSLIRSRMDDADMSQIPMVLDVHHIFVKKEEPLKRELRHSLPLQRCPPRQRWTGGTLAICESATRATLPGRRQQVDMSGFEIGSGMSVI